MRVVSLFDGCGMARQALKNLGIPLERYDACEIDKYAIQIATRNHPDIIHHGDVRTFVPEGEIDLLIGGSPCQDLSAASWSRTGLDGKRSGLFWEYVRILEEYQPEWFLLENVASMSKANRDIISETLGVEPIKIDSVLVSAQSRKRYYWTNIPDVTQPEDRGIILRDIIESGVADREKSYAIDAGYSQGTPLQAYFKKCRRQVVFKPDRIGALNKKSDKNTINTELTNVSRGRRVYSTDGKSVSLTASHASPAGLYLDNSCIRKLTPVECERLQTLPDGYTEGVSNTQRYKMLGNGFTVDVIAHILSFMRPQHESLPGTAR